MALTVATVALGTDMLVYGLAVPVLPFLARHYGASTGALGWTFSAYALTMLVVSPVAGVWLDRRGPRAPMLIGLAGLVVSCLLFATASSLAVLIGARVLQGASAAVSWTAAFALVSSRFPPAKRGGALGMAFAGVGVGIMVGPLLGGFLYQHVGHRSPFVVAAILATIDGILRWRLVRDPERAGRSPRITPLLRTRRAWLLVAVTLFGAACLAYFEPIVPGRMAIVARASTSTIGLAFAAAALVSFCVTPLAGAAADRVPPRWLLICGAAVGVGGALLTATAISAWVFAAGLAAIAAGAALILTPTLLLVAGLAERSTPPAYGGAYALYTMAYVAGLGVAPILSGSLTSSNGFAGASRAAAAAMAVLGLTLAAVGWSRLAQRRFTRQESPANPSA